MITSFISPTESARCGFGNIPSGALPPVRDLDQALLGANLLDQGLQCRGDWVLDPLLAALIADKGWDVAHHHDPEAEFGGEGCLTWFAAAANHCTTGYRIEVLAPVPENLKVSAGSEITALTMALPPTNCPVCSSFLPMMYSRT